MLRHWNTHSHTSTYTCLHISACTDALAQARTHVCTYKRALMHTRTPKCTHTCTHIQMHTRACVQTHKLWRDKEPGLGLSPGRWLLPGPQVRLVQQPSPPYLEASPRPPAAPGYPLASRLAVDHPATSDEAVNSPHWGAAQAARGPRGALAAQTLDARRMEGSLDPEARNALTSMGRQPGRQSCLHPLVTHRITSTRGCTFAYTLRSNVPRAVWSP